MPAKKPAQSAEPQQPVGETTDPGPREDDSAAEPSAEDVGIDVVAPSKAQPGRVRRTQRTIHRHSVDEEVVETIVEDLPAAYSPPGSGYPATVG